MYSQINLTAWGREEYEAPRKLLSWGETWTTFCMPVGLVDVDVDFGFLVEALLAGAEEDDADDALAAAISVLVPPNTALQRDAAAAAAAMGASLLFKTLRQRKEMETIRWD
jgi:hypothetical protein